MPRRAPNKKKLNDLIIRNLKPRGKRPYLLWDTKQHGLSVQVQPSGVKSWKCIYPFHGRPRWFSIGRVGDIDLTDARKKAGKIMVQVGDGIDPQADRKAMRGEGKFEELATQYVEQYAKRKNKSWKQAESLVKKHLTPKWGKLRAASITRSDVKAMMGRIKAPIVANQTFAAASAIFSWAISEEVGGVKINPCHGVDRNDTQSRERVLSDTELPQFWTAFEGAQYVRGRALKMILLTGQRPGEVTHMRTEHITKDGWWEMPGKPVPALDWPGTKNGASHRVWLSAPAQTIIADMDAKGFVFAGVRGKPIDKLEAVMKTICTSLAVERATPHDLRRTFGTKVTGLKHGRDAMDRLLNHKRSQKGKETVTDVYDRFEYGADDKRIVVAVAAHIMSLVDGSGADNVVPFAQIS